MALKDKNSDTDGEGTDDNQYANNEDGSTKEKDNNDEGESSSLDSSNDNNELLNGNLHTAIEYAVPSDQKEALHYDEVNQLKMEIKRHPNILRREY